MRVIDSHTEGEPTRLVLSGFPDLGPGSIAERARQMARDHAGLCRALLSEPRGHDAIVGALLLPPAAPDCVAGVVFFNTEGNLGMCGHATIGTAVTLGWLGRIGPGRHLLETPAGVVEVDLHDTSTVSVQNVESYRHLQAVTVQVPGLGAFTGDVAWGGNWFFLCSDPPFALDFGEIPRLTDAALRLRAALAAQGITGREGAPIDHIEFFGPSPRLDARNFVLCPGGAYDRSPCGTGSAAKLACLAADGALAPGQEWVQESIIGSTYRLRHAPGRDGGIVATITGRAWVTAETTLIFDPADPYVGGIRPARG